MFTVVDLCSGIGGFSLGLERTGGFKTVLFCEINEFCQKVLAKHWPDVPLIERVEDVTTESLRQLGIERTNVITAGFPCQPYSTAGKQLGAADPRHLWPKLSRCIRDLRPTHYVILENVPRILSISEGMVFGEILGDLAACGYDAEWQVLPASAFGAWHRRDRVWIVAYPNGNGRQESKGTGEPDYHPKRNGKTPQQGRNSVGGETESGCLYAPDATCERCRKEGSNCQRSTERVASSGEILAYAKGEQRERPLIFSQGWPITPDGSQWLVESDVGRVVDGFPGRVDRLRALGNSLVPQVVEWIGYQILRFDETTGR